MIANPSQNPMQFIRSLWSGGGFSLPGMVAPTFSTDDLGKRISDLKAVEGWLRMNLSMLQMTIQGLEMQQTTLSTVEAVGKIVRNSSEGSSAPAEGKPGFTETSEGPTVGETLKRAALWPWDVMQQMQEKIQKHLQEDEKKAKPAAGARKKPAARKPSAKTPPATASVAASAKKPAPRKTPRKAAPRKTARA
ncbi:MAG: hypothetical protein LBQ75_09750 [Zoogloeaceae bacterium]|jgi:hypothetical protein|nr:hypothetical protein [Zoogloeaceae bacterium]